MPRLGKVTVSALIGACALGIVAGSVAVAEPEATGQTSASDVERANYAIRFMQLFDTDGDGKAEAREIADDQVRLFRALDIDGDGMLSVEEVRRRGYILQIWRVTTMFDLMDVNGDRQLAIEEVSAPMKRWFSRYDANGDGFMDASEVPYRNRPGEGRRSER